MDEGLNSFMEYMAEQELGTNFPSRRGPAKTLFLHDGRSKFLEPIMSFKVSECNKYGKPAQYFERNINGRELFDYALKCMRIVGN
jgi:hypothetical protein